MVSVGLFTSKNWLQLKTFVTTQHTIMLSFHFIEYICLILITFIYLVNLIGSSPFKTKKKTFLSKPGYKIFDWTKKLKLNF